jgi:hypothetical protein
MPLGVGGSRIDIVSQEDLEKAISAGGYNSAPSALTGGSALQVEDKKLKFKNQIKAAVRDWDRVTPFRKFLKHRLPEASDEFIDHFVNATEQLTVKKAQKEVLKQFIKAEVTKKVKAKKPKAPVEPESDEDDEDFLPEPKADDPVLIQGVPANPSSEYKKGVKFNEKTGVLHTNRGEFPTNMMNGNHEPLARHMASMGMSNEDAKAKFIDAMHKNRDSHQRAMKSWIGLNERFRQGDVSPETVSHAILFALASPGNPVPTQEFMYSHLVDAIKNKGLTSVQTPEDWKRVVNDWHSRNPARGNQLLPEHAREYFERIVASRQPGQPVKGLVTKEGMLQGFAKQDQLAGYAKGYFEEHHKHLTDAIRNAGGDARTVARVLTETKGIGNKIARKIRGRAEGCYEWRRKIY